MKRLVINVAELEHKLPEYYDFLLTTLKQWVAEEKATWEDVEEFENGEWLAELSTDDDETELFIKAGKDEQGIIQQSPWGEDDITDVEKATFEMLENE